MNAVNASGTATFDYQWRRSVARHGNNDFLIFQDADDTVTQWSYGDFDDVVQRTAASLAALGLRPGRAQHVALRNCPAFIATWLACTRLGATFVPVDPASSARDLRSQTTRVKPVVAICARERAAEHRAALSEIDGPPSLVELTETALDLQPGSAMLAESVGTATFLAPRPSDRMAIMFTSGTTSQPKGVVLTQHNYWNVAEVMAAAVDLRSEHRWLVTLPLFHANAQYYCFAPAIRAGASVALTSAFSASRWLHQAVALNATHASLFAAPMRMILARTPQDGVRAQLQHVWFAQSLGADHYEQFTRLVGVRPRQLYGMTETVAIVTADSSEPRRHDVIGKPVAGRLLRFSDEPGHDIDGTEPRMLWVGGTRGQDLFLEYLDDPDTTNGAFDVDDGTDWFRTGDMVTEDGTGALRFVGRADDVIKVAGENVSLTEVEAVVAQAPGVFEACVVARGDAIRDVVPVAYVVPADPANIPDTASLEAFASEHLSPQSRPREWHFVDTLPRTSVGKIRRFALKAAAEEHVAS